MRHKWKRSIVAIVSIIMSLSGGVLYIAHDIVNIPPVPKEWSDKWALLVILAGILNKAGQSIISHLSPEKPNARSNSKPNLRPKADTHADSDTPPIANSRPRRPNSHSATHPNPNSNASFSDPSS